MNSPRKSTQSRTQQFAVDQHLLPWNQVHEQWNRRSGEQISRSAVWQIGQRAELKLRIALQKIASDFGILPPGGTP